MDGRHTGRSKPRGGPSAPGLLLMVEHWCLCSPLLGPRSRAPGHDREMDAIARPPDKLRPHHTESRGPSRAPRMPHVTLANNNNITAVSIHIMHGWRPYTYTPILQTVHTTHLYITTLPSPSAPLIAKIAGVNTASITCIHALGAYSRCIQPSFATVNMA